MEYPGIFGAVFILICAVESLPRPQELNDSRYRRNANTNTEARSTIKFPNHSKVPMAQIVRPPQGTWSREKLSNQSRASSNAGSDVFVFPDEISEQPIFVPKFGMKTTPECAAGSTFCERVDNYPGSYLENILQATAKAFNAMFGNDVVNEHLLHRIDAIDDNPLCASVEQVVYPKTAKNKDNKWLFVVNQGQYTQGVRIEKCLSPDESQSCAFTEGFPLGYKTYCKQKYIYRKLIALDENGKTITDTFQLPSCCACTVRADPLRSRLGSIINRQSPRIKNTQKPSTTKSS